MSFIMTREQARPVFQKYNKSESLLRHALHVSYVMEHFAALNNEDIEKWAAIGLLHDIDFELYPEEHCKKAVEILQNEGVPEDWIHSVVSHGYGICSDVAPDSRMEKILFTIDELTGLIHASSLMRPSRSFMDLELKSVMKKYKTANFAAGVDRSVIEKGCEMIDMDLPSVINEVILGLRKMEEACGHE